VTAEARLHRAPAMQSEVVAVVPKGSHVAASACTGGWCYVNWNGKQGYALAKNLRTRGSGPPAVTEDRSEEPEGGEDADDNSD